MDKLLIYDIESFLDTIVISDNSSYFFSDGNVDDSFIQEMDDNSSLNLNQEHNPPLIEEEHLCPDWVNQRIKLGLFGEGIAEKYLKEHFIDVLNVTSDSRKGYDIEATNENVRIHVEVKTTITSNTFHVSINELKKAEQFKETYWIFFIKVLEQKKQIKGYIIRDPIQRLSIPMRQLTNTIESNSMYLGSNSFTIELKPNFIMELEEEELHLTRYIEKEL